MNILMPIAGAGKRFENAGYTFPKPLIPIPNFNGNPMVKVVVDNLNLNGNYIFVCRKEHIDKYHIDVLLKTMIPDCKVLSVNYLTDGSARTCLLAKDIINTDESLCIADCDHFPIWNSTDFTTVIENQKEDGLCVTFENYHPKFSYVKTNSNGYITEIKEKEVISNKANVGIYYWKHGSDYVKYAERMISKNIRVNNEFYVAPVFNEAIQDDKLIKEYPISKQWELGTPEDLDYFLKNYENS
jgi:NDP-sugar pyrophosphorylase family protein